MLSYGYGLFTTLLRIIVAWDFSPSSFKLKKGTIDQSRFYFFSHPWEFENV